MSTAEVINGQNRDSTGGLGVSFSLTVFVVGDAVAVPKG